MTKIPQNKKLPKYHRNLKMTKIPLKPNKMTKIPLKPNKMTKIPSKLKNDQNTPKTQKMSKIPSKPIK